LGWGEQLLKWSLDPDLSDVCLPLNLLY